MHETLDHFHKPKDEAEANQWMRPALVTYNNSDHRADPHCRIEDWLKHLRSNGLRAMCSWERFCASAGEPGRRRVAGDGIAYTARHDPHQLCFALFDRCEVQATELSEDLDAEWFWELADVYKMGRPPV